MNYNPYFPKSNPERVVWVNNYLAKLPALGVICGIQTSEITTTQADLAFYLWVTQVWYPAMQQEAMSATVYRDMIANGPGTSKVALPVLPTFSNVPAVATPGVLPRLFNQIGRIKMSSAYTESIGRDLGIIGSSTGADTNPPEFSLTVEPGSANQLAKVAYMKHGHEGVHIESRRGAGAWELVGVSTSKAWRDKRPLLEPGKPEQRDYRLRWWDKDEPNGDYSGHQSISVAP